MLFDVGDEGPLDGDPVVLLHGFPQRASSWDLVAPLLHDLGLRTLAPDQRGQAPGPVPAPVGPRPRTWQRSSRQSDAPSTWSGTTGAPWWGGPLPSSTQNWSGP